MTKIYVVTETNYEYNDEYYYAGEGSGGSPIHAYTDKSKAESACKESTKKWLEINDLTDYGYVAEGVFDVERFCSMSGLTEDEVISSWDSNSLNELVSESVSEEHLIDSLRLSIFEVIEIELNQ